MQGRHCAEPLRPLVEEFLEAGKKRLAERRCPRGQVDSNKPEAVSPKHMQFGSRLDILILTKEIVRIVATFQFLQSRQIRSKRLFALALALGNEIYIGPAVGILLQARPYVFDPGKAPIVVCRRLPAGARG